MSTQTYATHAHRPVLTLAAALLWLTSAVGWVAYALGQPWGLGLGVAGLLLAVFALIAISRAFTTRLQDRIILLEMQLRAERLLTPAQRSQYGQLDKAQVVALRFASDAELPALCERAAVERLEADAIKRAITTWRADLLRT